MNEAKTEALTRRTFRGTAESLQRAAEEPDLAWRVLSTVNLFRVLIAVGLLAVSSPAASHPLSASDLPRCSPRSSPGISYSPCFRPCR
jgi:hypothetical protein